MSSLSARLRAFVLSANIVLCACLTAAPTISQQPGVVTAMSAQPATFQTDAAGTGTVRYQWRHFGSPIAGATGPSLTLPAVTMADAGFYDVVVTDDNGAVTSQPGRLVVAPVGGYPNLLRLDTSFAPQLEGPSVGAAKVLVSAPGGGYYVGGSFNQAGTVGVTALARVGPDGAIDASFMPGLLKGSTVTALAVQADGRVLASGNLYLNSGQLRYLLRFNTDGTLDSAFASGAGSIMAPQALALQVDGRILLTDGFRLPNGGLRYRAVRLHSDGSMDGTFAWGNGFDGAPNCLLVDPDGCVVVGGSFSEYQGLGAARLVRLLGDGQRDTAFVVGSGFLGAVNTVARQSDGRIVAGGDFGSYNGAACSRIARLNTDGSFDGTFVIGSGFSSTVSSLQVLPGDGLLVAGNFTSYDGEPAPRVVRLQNDGARDAVFGLPGTGFNAAVQRLAVLSDGRIAAAGAFVSLDGTAVPEVLRLSAAGALDSMPAAHWLYPVAANAVVPVEDGKWLVGGDFTRINGVDCGRIARLKADGTLDTGFAPGSGFDNSVLALAVQGDGRILVGGLFTTCNGNMRKGVARLLADGSVDSAFTPASDLIGARSIALQADGRLVVGGGFVRGITRLNADGTVDPGFTIGSGFNSLVQAVLVQRDGGIAAVGFFNQFNGYARKYGLRLLGDGSLDLSFNAGPGFENYRFAWAAAETLDGGLVVGGMFNTFNYASCKGLVRFGADGSSVDSFNRRPSAMLYPTAVLPQADGAILVAGSVALARYHDEGWADTTFAVFDVGGQSSGGKLQYADDGRLLVTGVTGSRGALRQIGLVMLKSDADPRPLVTAQPENQMTSVGSAAAFTVAADGEPLTYQWYKDGVALAGATEATLSLPAVQTADFGVYAVIATNPFGSTTSAPALLGVGGVAGTSYRLADYYYPLVQGNTWLHESPTDPEVRTRITIGAVQTINSYTGRTAPVAAAVAVMPVQSVHGSDVGGVFTPHEDWTDFISFEGGRFRFWGNDEDAGASQTRAGDGLEFPASLPVGGSAVMEQDLYQNGVWVGGVRAGIRLLGVETITVPAGTFSGCLHLQILFARTDGVQTNEEWWAPGIGMVKHLRAEDNWDDRQMLSYTVVPAVQISTPPVGTTIGNGTAATLNVAAAGSVPLVYQWYEGDSGDTSRPVGGATGSTFNTPVLNAWSRYWVRVSSLAGLTDSPTTLVEVTGGTMTVADWMAQGAGTPQGTLPAAQRAPLATPAGDGVTNLMKFALGVPPLESAAAHLPAVVTIPDAGVPVALALDFAINPDAVGIRYALEVSDNCVTWTEVAYLLEEGEIESDGTQLVRLREKTPPAAVRRFARLKVEVAP